MTRGSRWYSPRSLLAELTLILMSGCRFVVRLAREVLVLRRGRAGGVLLDEIFDLGLLGVGPLLESFEETFDAKDRSAAGPCVSSSSPEQGVGGDGSF